MRIAAAAYPLEPLTSWETYAAKISAWVSRAATEERADLLVFPEYAAMEIAMQEGPQVAADLEHALAAVTARRTRMEALHAELAIRHGVHILAGSTPAATGAGRPVNRASLFGPTGLIGAQDKLIMTRFEREDWDIAPGAGPVVFDTALGKLGVIICYDAEFPLIARAMVAAGAEILLAPSCTETAWGYHRVRVGAMARALENQCVVVHAPLIADAPWCPAIEAGSGAAALYGPADLGFPATGVIAEGAMDSPGWVTAEVTLDQIRRVRRAGAVFNHAHWAEQDSRLDHVEMRAAP